MVHVWAPPQISVTHLIMSDVEFSTCGAMQLLKRFWDWEVFCIKDVEREGNHQKVKCQAGEGTSNPQDTLTATRTGVLPGWDCRAPAVDSESPSGSRCPHRRDSSA